eukprot:sb/3463802/
MPQDSHSMFLDDFEPLFEISCTELSQTYAAKRYDSEKEVIVKVLEGDRRQYSLHNNISIPDEILVNKRLNYPDLFQAWDEFFFEDGVWFIVFERSHGWYTLKEFIQEHGPLSEDESRYIIQQLLNMLTVCHLNDIDPRNLTPGNILIDPVMAMWSNGGTTYPDVLFTLGLLLSALIGIPLNSLALYRNYKKPANIARTLYLLLQVVDLGTCLFVCPSVAYTISTPKDPKCFEDETDPTIKFPKNCTTNYITFGYKHPSNFRRAWSLLCSIFAYSPCILTGMLAMSRYYQIKYPFRRVSRRLVIGTTTAGAAWLPIWYTEMIRRKGDDNQAMYMVLMQQVVTAFPNLDQIDMFGIEMSLEVMYLIVNSVSSMFQGCALIASVATIVVLVKLNKGGVQGSKLFTFRVRSCQASALTTVLKRGIGSGSYNKSLEQTTLIARTLYLLLQVGGVQGSKLFTFRVRSCQASALTTVLKRGIGVRSCQASALTTVLKRGIGSGSYNKSLEQTTLTCSSSVSICSWSSVVIFFSS